MVSSSADPTVVWAIWRWVRAVKMLVRGESLGR